MSKKRTYTISHSSSMHQGVSLDCMKTLKEYRADLGLSVAEMLELTGWSQSTYDRISKGERELTKAEHFMLCNLPKKRRKG